MVVFLFLLFIFYFLITSNNCEDGGFVHFCGTTVRFVGLTE